MDTTTKSGRGAPVRLFAWSAALIVFVLPWGVGRFMSGFDWTAYDYIVWAALVLGTGLLIELAVRVLRTPLYRLIAVGAILALALLVWADGAVGVF